MDRERLYQERRHEVVKRLVLSVAPALAAMVLVVVCVSYYGARQAELGEATVSLEWLSWATLAIMLGAFFCEYVDSTLGMGYGTTLTPVLLLFGFKTLDVVPAVLFSELFTGVVAGISHHNAGNVSLKPGTRHFKISWVLGLCSIVGTLAAVFVAVSLPKAWLKLYIGVLVFSMGVIILVYRNKPRPFSWKKIVALGAVASFNKGMSGGGYGPVVTSGQILSGVDEKSSIGITSLAEGLTCAVGITAYWLFSKGSMPWHLAGPLAIGALSSVPLAAWSVKRMSAKKLTLAIGVITTVLGILTLWKAYQAF